MSLLAIRRELDYELGVIEEPEEQDCQEVVLCITRKLAGRPLSLPQVGTVLFGRDREAITTEVIVLVVIPPQDLVTLADLSGYEVSDLQWLWPVNASSYASSNPIRSTDQVVYDVMYVRLHLSTSSTDPYEKLAGSDTSHQLPLTRPLLEDDAHVRAPEKKAVYVFLGGAMR